MGQIHSRALHFIIAILMPLIYNIMIDKQCQLPPFSIFPATPHIVIKQSILTQMNVTMALPRLWLPYYAGFHLLASQLA
jgi:hypothetical protein